MPQECMGRRLRVICGCLFALALATLTGGCQTVSVVSPPGQPASGPGGADYPHNAVTTKHFGGGGEEYWLFLPADPQPAEAPVVVFLHGWGGTAPRVYGAWLEHIVRKGYIVIYPRYQASVFTAAQDMVPAALQAIQDALARLTAEGPVRPKTDRLAWVGHSLGGIISANLAAAYADNGLPRPAVLLCVAPGGETHVPVAPLGGLPTDTLVLLVVGDSDRAVSDQGATAIFNNLTHMPTANVELITVQSDRHSTPPLIADHLAPLSSSASFPPDLNADGQVADAPALRPSPWRDRRRRRQAARDAPNALDYYGYWKLLDGLLDAAFLGRNRDYALGNTPHQTDMGLYSDGVPVTPLLVEPLP